MSESTTTATPDTSSATDSAPITPAGSADPTKAAVTGETPPAVAKPADPPAPHKFRFKGKVDGKDVEEEIDETRLTAQWQKMKAADKRLAELADKEKRIQAALSKLSADPFEAMRDPALGGIDLEQMAIQRLADRFQREELEKNDPAAAERAKLQKELETERGRVKEYQTQQQAQQQAALQARVAQEVEQTFHAALEKSGLPRDPEVLALMAEIGLMNLDYGLDLTPEQLAAEAKARYEAPVQKASGAYKAKIETLDGDALVAELGEAVVKKVQNALLAKARAAIQTPQKAQPAQRTQSPDEKPREFQRDVDVMRRMGVWGS